VRLVKDNTRPHAPIDEALTRDGTLVVHHIQMLSTRFKVLRELPLGLAIVAAPDTEAAALRRLLPLVQGAKRSEEEGRVRLGLLDEAQNLDGFAEAHLIAEKATARLKSFTVFHPYHTLLLVLLVLKAIPKGDKVVHVQIRK
jgi:hypothetical protein